MSVSVIFSCSAGRRLEPWLRVVFASCKGWLSFRRKGWPLIVAFRTRLQAGASARTRQWIARNPERRATTDSTTAAYTSRRPVLTIWHGCSIEGLAEL